MDTKELASIFKALSNENRLEIYLQILNSYEESYDSGCECFVTEIIGRLKIGAPTISHHLKELSNARLIITEKKGKYLVARVNKELLEELSNILKISKEGN